VECRPDQGKTSAGIYALAGDRYQVCFAAPGKERPKEFATKAGSGLTCYTLKRAKE